MVSSISTRSHRSDSKTCVVPLFLSTKSQRSIYSQKRARSQSSTRGMIDPEAPPVPRVSHKRTTHKRRAGGSPSQRPSRTHTPARAASSAAAEQADMYTAYPPPQRQDTSTMSLPTQSTVSSNSENASSHSRSTFSSSSSTSRPRKPPPTHKRRTTTRTARLASHAASKKRLTVCFTITLFVAAIIYVVLFATKAAKGVLFHVFSILLIIILLAVAVHSCVRWMMLKAEWKEASERRDRKRKSPRERGWVIGRPYEVKVGGRLVGDHGVGKNRVMGDDEVPERAIPVFMRGDEEEGLDAEEENEDVGVGVGVGEARMRHEGADVGIVAPGFGEVGSRLEGLAGRVRPPPPVYGNFRSSVRMNPEFLHVRQVNVPPSPSTPTYAEAVSQANTGPKFPGMAGYRPPSYGSEGGLTVVLETRRRDVEAAMGRIHPLERERLDTLGFRS